MVSWPVFCYILLCRGDFATAGTIKLGACSLVLLPALCCELNRTTIHGFRCVIKEKDYVVKEIQKEKCI